MSEIIFTFDDGSQALMHYGVMGMKWGVRNAETRRKYAGGKGERKLAKQQERVNKAETKFNKAYTATFDERAHKTIGKNSIRRNIATRRYAEALNKQSYLKRKYNPESMTKNDEARAQAHEYKRKTTQYDVLGGAALVAAWNYTKNGKRLREAYNNAYNETVSQGRARVQKGIDATQRILRYNTRRGDFDYVMEEKDSKGNVVYSKRRNA